MLKSLFHGSVAFVHGIFNLEAYSIWTTDQQCQYWHSDLPARVVYSRHVKLHDTIHVSEAKLGETGPRFFSFECIQINPALSDIDRRQWNVYSVLPRSTTIGKSDQPNLNYGGCHAGFEPAPMTNIDIGICVRVGSTAEGSQASNSKSTNECDSTTTDMVHHEKAGARPEKCKKEYRTPEVQVLEERFIPQTFGVTEMFCLDHVMPGSL